MIKTCCRCETSQSITLFSKKLSSKDGYKSCCKKCDSIDRIKNKERDDKIKKKWCEQNKEKDKTTKKKYRKDNKEQINNKRREPHRIYESNKLKTDIQYKLRNRCRARLHASFTKIGSTVSYLGCSMEQFKKHIENQFESWMNWDNWGKFDYNRPTWQLDHIIPLANFDLTNKEELLKATHFSNLQPLLAFKNLSKGSKRLLSKE